MRVSFFPGVKQTTPQKNITLRDVADLIKSERYKSLIEEIRKTTDKDQKSELKKQLPIVVFGGTFSKRGNSHLEEASRLITVDIDDIGPDQVDELEGKLKQDKHIALLFRSPSNKLKGAFKVDYDIKNNTDNQNAWRQVNDYFLKNYDIGLDPATSDISRATFLSYDPDPYVKEDAEPYEIKQVQKKEENSAMGKYICPYHDDNDASLVMYEKGDWFCYGCGTSGEPGTFKNPDARTKRNSRGKNHYYLPSEGESPDEDKKSCLKVIDVADILNEPMPEVKWDIKDILTHNAVSMFAGEPGSYKSAFAILLCFYASCGKAFLNRFDIPKPLKCGFMNLEMSEKKFAQYLHKIAEGNGINKGDLREKFVHIPATGIKLDDDDDENYRKVRDLLKENPCDIIVVDSGVRAMQGDENAASDVRKLFDSIYALRNEFDTTFILIHHKRKPSNDKKKSTAHDVRGSGDFYAACDELWSFEKKKKNESGKQIDLICHKMRLTQEKSWSIFIEEGFKMRVLGEFEDYNPVKVAENCLVKWLGTKDYGFTFNFEEAYEVLKEDNVTKSGLRTILSKMRSDGRLGHGKHNRYSLLEKIDSNNIEMWLDSSESMEK